MKNKIIQLIIIKSYQAKKTELEYFNRLASVRVLGGGNSLHKCESEV